MKVSVAALPKAVVPEVNYHQQLTNNTSVSNAVIHTELLNPMVRGIETGDRIGREYQILSWAFHGRAWVNGASVGDQLWVCAVFDKHPGGGTLDASEVWCDSAITSFPKHRNPIGMDRYYVFCETTIPLASASSTDNRYAYFTLRKKFKPPLEVQCYDSDAADETMISRGALWFVMSSTHASGDDDSAIYGVHKVRFVG